MSLGVVVKNIRKPRRIGFSEIFALPCIN